MPYVIFAHFGRNVSWNTISPVALLIYSRSNNVCTYVASNGLKSKPKTSLLCSLTANILSWVLCLSIIVARKLSLLIPISSGSTALALVEKNTDNNSNTSDVHL